VLPANGDLAHTNALYLVGQHGDERAGLLTPFIRGTRPAQPVLPVFSNDGW
jgi:hypothetical protein